MTHPIWELPLHNEPGALILTPCPGTKSVSLADSIAQLKSQGVSCIVTAITTEEMHDCQVADLSEAVEEAGLQWFHTPIEDDQAPNTDFITRWDEISPSLHAALSKDEKVALHCMGGSGRTGLLAAHLLLEKNWQLTDIITKVQALRPGAFTKPLQVNYIRAFTTR